MGQDHARPKGKSNVVSIVRVIEQRRLDDESAQASATHRRLAELEAGFNRTMAQLEDLDLEGAIAELTEDPAPEAKVAWAELRSLRAFRSCRLGDVDGGLAEWDEVVAAVPGAASVYQMRARWLGQTDPAAALADCERAVAAEPRKAGAYAMRGDYHRVLDDLSRAVADYHRALSLDPSLYDVRYALGAALATQGRHDEALAAFGRAIRANAGYVEPYEARAGVLIARGDLAGAVRDLDAILRLDPSRDDIRLQRTILQTKIPGAEILVEDLDHCLELLPENPDLHCARARVLALSGRMSEAVEAASTALAHAPNHILAHRFRAVYRSHADESEAASLLIKADLHRAWELSPRTAIYRQELIEYLIDHGDVDDALAVLDRAIELEPESADLWFERGSTKARRGELIYSNSDREDDETDEQERARCLSARADLERALALGKRDEDTYGELIAAAEGFGDEDALLAEMDRVIEAMPDFMMAIALRESRRRHRGDAAGAAADHARLVELGWNFGTD